MRNLVLLFLLCFDLVCSAQAKVKSDYIYCYKETVVETDDYKIYIVSGQNEYEFAKFKIRIFNKTNDYLIFKPSDCAFLIGSEELVPKDKQIMVLPNSESARVLDVKGRGCQVDKYTFEIKTYYKLSNSGTALQVEDFNVPPGKNDFKAGAFDCRHLDHKLTSVKSTFKFECTYKGDGLGILDPYKCSAVMPGGKDNANSKRYDPVLLEKGKREDFFVEIRTIPNTGDMATEPFKIKWNDTFKDSKLESLKGIKIEIDLDKARTEEKNK